MTIEKFFLEVQKIRDWKGHKTDLNFQKDTIYLIKIHVFAENPNSLLEIIYAAHGKDNRVASLILNKKENDFEFLFTPYTYSKHLEFRMSSYDGYSTGKMHIIVTDVLTIKTDVNGKDLEKSIKIVGPWFHQLNLKGLKTRDVFKVPLKGDRPYKGQIFSKTMEKNSPCWIWDELKNFIPKNLNGKKVLDVACSNGFYSFEFAKRGADVIGFDNLFSNIVRCTFAKKILNIRNVSFRYLDVNDLENTFNGQFDMILCAGLLYHLDDPQKTIDQVAKLTKLAYFETIINEDIEESILIRDEETTADGYIPTRNWLFNAFKKAGFLSVVHLNPSFRRAIFRVEK